MQTDYSGKQGQRFTVKDETGLMQFLINMMKGKSRTGIKSLLSGKQVHVNNQVVTRYNLVLLPGDIVLIAERAGSSAFGGIKILFEDDEIIAVEKKSGLLSVPVPDGPKNNAFGIITDYTRQHDRRCRLFIVHRLDQYTSGVMIFVKNEKLQHALRDAWQEQVEERVYIAVIEGCPEKKEGSITSWMKENKSYHMYSSKDKEHGKKAVTHYKILQTGNQYSLAEIWLETGRKNQIRVHFQDLGFPVAGDRKYGAATDPCQRLMLHAKTLHLIHPFTNKKYCFESPVPGIFQNCFRDRP